MADLETIEGIGPTYGARLRKAGVRGTEDLLELGSTPEGRAELARRTRFSADRLLEWVHRADLMRVRGISEEYSDLLEWSGIASVVQLSAQNPDVVVEKVTAAAAGRRLVRRLPSRRRASQWIEHARRLPRRVWYHDTWGSDELTGRHPTMPLKQRG